MRKSVQNQTQQEHSANPAKSEKMTLEPGRDVSQILQLQRMIGNQAILRLLQAQQDSTRADNGPLDDYEQKASEVADTVAKGRPSEYLPDRYARSEAATPFQVQLQLDLRSKQYKPAQPGLIQRSDNDKGVTGPPDVRSNKLRSGTMKWSLAPMPGYVNARIEFIPEPAVAAASKTISFIQTVSNTLTTGGLLGLGSSRETSATEVDAGQKENDPFYGAKWDGGAGKWGGEPNSTQTRPGDYQGQGGAREGSRPFTAQTGSAVLNDSPMLKVNETKQFETAVVVVETGQVLGSLRWNIQRWLGGFFNDTTSTIVQNAQCVEGASADFSAVVEQFYSSMAIIDGFAPGSVELPATHQQRLAPIVAKLGKEPDRRVVVGGAATQDEPNPAALSRGRAEKVRAYLVGEGIAEARIDLEAYGSDWARSPTAKPGSEQANRRVQVKIL